MEGKTLFTLYFCCTCEENLAEKNQSVRVQLKKMDKWMSLKNKTSLFKLSFYES